MLTSQKVYICNQTGSDVKINSSGSLDSPWASLNTAVATIDDGESIFMIRKDQSFEYEPASKSALKKAKQCNEINERKLNKLSLSTNKLPSSCAISDVPLEEDPLLPPSTSIKIKDAITAREQKKRVRISGWVHRLRRQGKSMMFVILRDGTGYIQCLFNSEMVLLNYIIYLGVKCCS